MSGPRPTPRRALSRLTNALVWLAVAGAAVEFVEPAPFDVLALMAMAAAIAAGMRAPRDLAPFVLLLSLFCVGGYLGLAVAANLPKAVVWTSITLFLSIAALFFAVYVRGDPEPRARLILNAYMLAALAATALAIIGYFGKIDLFLRFSRASGTFKDPNVLGSFLTLPSAYLAMRVLDRPLRKAFWPSLGYGLVGVGVLLTFSRGAWGLFVFASLATGYLAFVTSRSTGGRARMLLVGVAGCALLAAGLLAMLSIDAVADLLKTRAAFEQSYDSQYLGRFDRHVLGFMLAQERPLGVGPHEFAKLFPEDPHNVYLNGLMSYGWIGGLAYAALVVWTLGKGLRLALTARPAIRPYAIPVVVTFIGIAVEGAVIDTDHWRHFYLLVSLIWGLSLPKRRALRPQPAPTRQAAPAALVSGIPQRTG